MNTLRLEVLQFIDETERRLASPKPEPK